MYVIFPADEVVYLSYGRVIYVPPIAPSQQVIRTTTTEPDSSFQSNRNQTSIPSLPSTSTGSTRSNRSSLGNVLNGFASDNNSEKNSLKRTKSTKSKQSKESDKSEEKPIRGKSPKPKCSDNTGKSPAPSVKSQKDQYLQVPSSGKEKSPTPQRRLSYSDFLPHHAERFNINNKKEKSPKKSLKPNSSATNFDELFRIDPSNNSNYNPSRLQIEKPQYNSKGETYKFCFENNKFFNQFVFYN